MPGSSVTTTNTVTTLNPQCQVLWFPWKQSDEALANSDLTTTDPNTLSDADAWDISDHLDYCSFSKHLGDVAGTFTIRLDSTKDWKNFIKPGHWMLILMSQDGDLNYQQVLTGPTASTTISDTGNKESFKNAPQADSLQGSKLRGICRVDRISASVSTGAKGEYITTYNVTGRDFGCVYQDTGIWYNLFINAENFLKTFNAYLDLKTANDVKGSIKYLLALIHDVFLSVSVSDDNKDIYAIIQAYRKNLDIPAQWVMPKKLLTLIGQLPANGSPYFGDLPDIKNFDYTPFSVPLDNPLNAIEGNLWERLKQYSAEPYHELFAETDSDGLMHLTYRLIPWGIDQSGYPDIAKYAMPFSDLVKDGISLTSTELISLDLGEDTHNRFNYFLSTLNPFNNINVSPTVMLNQDSIKGRRFPLPNKPSISRNGFRPQFVDVNTFYIGFGSTANTDKANSPVNINYMIEGNEMTFDLWNKYSFKENGSMTIIGKNEIKLGMALNLDETFPYNPNSSYYIEGYDDEFTVDENGACSWVQHLYLTNGSETANISNGGSGTLFSAKTQTYNKGSSFINKK